MALQLKNVVMGMGAAFVAVSLGGCSLLQMLQGKEGAPAQNAVVAQEAPKLVGYKGMRMCQPYEDGMWGSFMMVGTVVSIDSPWNMHINVLRAESMDNSSISMTGYPRLIVDQRQKWYPCDAHEG